MRSWLQTGVSIGCGAWLTACGATGKIGADACPRGAKCEAEPLALPRSSTEVHSTGPSLAPAWKASMLELEGSVVAQVDEHSRLAMGHEGCLWLFTPEPGRVQVALLDLSGRVVSHTTLEPPPGAEIQEDVIVALRENVASHPRGPVVGVEWSAPCPGTVPGGCSAVMSELIVFGTSGAEPESRGFPYPINSLVDTFETLHRSADGDAVFLTSNISGLKKVDLEGNTLWASDLSLDQFDQLPNRTSLRSGVTPFRSGTVSPDGGLVFGVDILLKKSEAWDWRYFAGGLLHIDGDGAKSVRLYEDGGHAAFRSTDVAGLGQGAIGELPSGHAHVALAYDRRDRLLAVYQELEGDLVVLRVSDDDVESFRILREDYADLRLYDVSMDPAGTLYISTQGGGREEGSEVPLLCRVPEEGSPGCVSIPSASYDIEAAAPGVVYALSSEPERELLRFDFE